LRSALAQELPFHEIIVVDNRSDDRTAQIAAGFPGVRILQEGRQGVVHARNAGFAAARGDVIARIDADTRLPADWTAVLDSVFQDMKAAAVTGKVSYYEIEFARVLSVSDNLIRRCVVHLLGKDMALQGANMAIRKSVWEAVQSSTCNQPGVHEDFDLAIHVAEHGYRVKYEPKLSAAVAFRQAASPWRQFVSYYWHCPTTYLAHGLSRGVWLMPVAAGMILAFPLLHAFSRTYQRRMMAERPALRANPATFGE